MNLKDLLEHELNKRNNEDELSFEKPDPLFIAKKYNDEYIALICALFAYGNALSIIKFLDTLDFDLLNKDEENIRKSLQNNYYRFQNSEDVIQFFIALSKLKKKYSLNDLFIQEYKKDQNIVNSIHFLQKKIYEEVSYTSRGFEFLIGKPNSISSTLKRWNMYLRWMVRDDHLDLGLWKNVNTKDLLLPLDTHTFNVSLRLGLLKRKTYDIKAVYEVTNNLKKFNADDPVRYDFAIYRLGQEKLA
jgi:uncharacterized protein (TIGR02757 family)